VEILLASIFRKKPSGSQRLGNRMARTTLRLIWSRPSTVLVKLPDGGGGMGPVRSDSPSTDVNQGVRRIPYYLVLRAGHECYVLDVRRDLIRRGASQLLKIFARRHSAARPIDGAAWDAFSSTHEFSAGERATRCMFSLVAGEETPRQLDLLAML
jgi:hypothetical protein